MNIDLKGVIKVIFNEVQITDNLSKKEFVVTIDGDSKYPQDICIQAINTKIDLLKEYKTGDLVIVKCNLKGKESKSKYYNQISLWEIQNKNRGVE